MIPGGLVEPWPRDVPPPRCAPHVDRAPAPVRRLRPPRQGEREILLAGLGAMFEEAQGLRGLLRASWRVLLFWASLLMRERDAARAEARWASRRAARAVRALEAAAELRLDAELRLEAARAALPALEAALAAGRRVDVAEALAPLIGCLRGGGSR